MLVWLLLACVRVDLRRVDTERACWAEETDVRPLAGWHGYGNGPLHGGCADLSWTAVDADGSCIRLSGLCNDEVKHDLGECEDNPACCDGSLDQLPACPEL